MRYLAFDLGAESGRAVIGTLDKGNLLLEEVYRFPNRPLLVQGHLHWDVYRLFEELKHGLQAATSKYRDICSLGIDTWGVDFGLLSGDGILIGLPFMYRDEMTEGIPDEVYGILDEEEVYLLTGSQTMPFNTLFQLYALARKQPGYLDSARHLLFMPDLLNYFFTGRRATDQSIASTSHLYNPSLHRWEKGLLDTLGLPSAILGQPVPSGTAIGALQDDLAAECNAAGINVVCVASHDTASAIVSVPASGRNWAYLSSGTWSLMGAELPSPQISSDSKACQFTNEVGFDGRIRYLKNIVGLWLLQGIRRSYAARGRDYTYPELVALAENASPFSALIDVNDASFMKMGDMTGHIDAFCRRTGQPPLRDPGSYTRCVLESLAMCYREVMRNLQRLTGSNYDTLHVVGGGARNAMLDAFTASAAGIRVVAGPDEATAAGNILVQAICRGELRNLEEARQVVKASFALQEFLPEETAAWDEGYADYSRICASNTGR